MDTHPSRSKLGHRPLELSSIGCCDLGECFVDGDDPYLSLSSHHDGEIAKQAPE